jgi:signal transduction histidine kinase
MALCQDVTPQVTARKKLEHSEQQLLHAQKELKMELEAGRQLQQQKDDFIGIASHELKTPLTTLKGSMQLLSQWMANEDVSPKVQRLIQLSNSNINKLSHILKELLNDTRINEGQLHLNKSLCSIAELFNDCCESFNIISHHQIYQKGDLNLSVFVDRDRIIQVIINLINNAIKYAPNSQEIILSASEEGNQVKISVRDFGPGIPAEKIPHLFKRYYRVDTSGIQYSGLGLGLFIASDMVSRHGGKIGVESEAGAGATFWFTIPLA